MRKKRGIRAIICMMALVAALCGAGCLAPEPPAPEEGPDFHQVTEGYDDRIVFYVIPYRDEPATYVVNYTIFKNGTTYESRSDAVYGNISGSAPIVFEVPRSPDESISLKIEVRSTGGRILHSSSTVINSVRMDATGTPLYPVEDQGLPS
jgi:hypothetical protein